MYGVRNMEADTYDKEFKPWYKQLIAGKIVIGVSKMLWLKTVEQMLSCWVKQSCLLGKWLKTD